MTQQQWEVLSLKAALIVSIAGLLFFVVDYTRMTKWAAWKDEIGQTILIKDIFMVGQVMPLLLAVFFKFSTVENRVATWVFVGFYFLVGLAMFWRTWRFEKVYRRRQGRTQGHEESIIVSDQKEEQSDN